MGNLSATSGQSVLPHLGNKSYNASQRRTTAAANSIGKSYIDFTNYANKSQMDLFEAISNGTIKTEAQRAQIHNEIANRSFDVTGEEYRELKAKGKNRTEAETQKMKDLYRDSFVNLGQSYIEAVEEKVGNGDGVLTQEEFVKYETLDLPDELKGDSNAQDAKNIFSHVDIDKNGKLDKKEMAAMFSAFDMSIGVTDEKAGSINGKITVADMNGNMVNLIKDSTTEGGQVLDERMDMMYEFVFGTN